MIINYLQNFIQTNKGDNSGTIWATKNIDPQLNPGKVNISKVLGFRTNTDEASNLEAPASGFAFTSAFATDRYYAVADDRVWQSASTNPNSGWSEVSSSPTDCDINSDIISFNQKIYIATQNYLKSYTPGAGFNNINGISAVPHSFAIFANRLYVTDNQDKIESMNTSETYVASGSNTINLNTTTGDNILITKIASVSDGIWIATVYTDKSGGEMLFWDGETENVLSARYYIPRGALAMCIKDDRPYIIDSLGRLRFFDGTTFREIGRLPIRDENLDNFNENSNDRFIHPNGMIVVNDEIYALISNKMSDSTQNPIDRLPSGIWAWNETNGFYHKYSFADFDIVDETPKDFGASELASVGALFRSDATGGSTVDRDDESEIMAGISYYSDATTQKTAFAITNVINDIKKGGYFVVIQLNVEKFDEIWKEVIATFDKFKNSTDRIVISYRTSEDTPIYGTGTWSTDTILRTSADLSTIEQGDEIEILRGNGSGVCFSIDSITDNYRLQLDFNPLSGMSGTCRFRASKWKKLKTCTDTDISFLRSEIDSKQGAWIQFKIFMVGTGMSPQINKLIGVSSPNSDYK